MRFWRAPIVKSSNLFASRIAPLSCFRDVWCKSKALAASFDSGTESLQQQHKQKKRLDKITALSEVKTMGKYNNVVLKSSLKSRPAIERSQRKCLPIHFLVDALQQSAHFTRSHQIHIVPAFENTLC
jgi:hypothetical protein